MGKKVSTLRNKASGQCVGTTGDTIADCGPKTSALLYYNVSASQLSLGALVPGVVGSARRCLDINHALSPNVDTYHCHPVYAGGGGERDFANQQFKILSAESDAAARSWKQLGSVSAGGQCLSLLNSFPPSPAAPKNVSWTQRLEKFARLLKSAGVNGVVLNDVNACYQDNQLLLQSSVLQNVSANLGPTFARYGITPYVSACFPSPILISNIAADPAAPAAQRWWAAMAAEIWKLFGAHGSKSAGFW